MKKMILFTNILVFISSIFGIADFLKGKEIQLSPEQKALYYQKVLEDPEANSFNPLHVGNKWWYEVNWDDPQIPNSINLGRMITDSVYIDNQKFYRAEGALLTYPVLIRNIDNTTVLWDSLDSDESQETDYLLDEDFEITEINYENALTVYHTIYNVGGGGPFTSFQCYLLGQGFIEYFGTLTEYKAYKYFHLNWPDVVMDCIWARGFGMVMLANEWTVVNIEGCIINNVHYGNTTASESTAPVKINEIEINSFPNPVRSNVQIRYKLPKNSSHSKIEIFNCKGQLVHQKSISDSGSFNWNTMDTKGKPVASGIYFIHVKTENQQTTKKMLMIK